MTQQQETMLKRIKAYIEESDLHKNHPDYEFKEYEVKENDHGTVIVYSVAGLKGDEGTMAAVLCRTRRHIFIGKRGGLSAYGWNAAKKKSIDLNGWSEVMHHGYEH